MYNQLLDILVSQLEECFKAFIAVTEKFNVLNSILLGSANDNGLSKHFKDHYNKDLM